MKRLSTSFVRERELIIVHAEVVGPAGRTKARLVLDTGAAATTLVPEVIEEIGYTRRDAYKAAKVHTAVGEEQARLLPPALAVDGEHPAGEAASYVHERLRALMRRRKGCNLRAGTHKCHALNDHRQAVCGKSARTV
jgi:hypothetical protein